MKIDTTYPFRFPINGNSKFPIIGKSSCAISKQLKQQKKKTSPTVATLRNDFQKLETLGLYGERYVVKFPFIGNMEAL